MCRLLFSDAILRLVVATGTDRQRKLGAAFLQLKLVLDKGNGVENEYLGAL